jgi:hypothetical protein
VCAEKKAKAGTQAGPSAPLKSAALGMTLIGVGAKGKDKNKCRSFGSAQDGLETGGTLSRGGAPLCLETILIFGQA